jgi:hypothetical protein
MVFATDTVTVALPDEAVRTHASVVVLFLVADAGCLSVEAIVLFFSDRNLLAGSTDVDEIGLLLVFALHNVSSINLPPRVGGGGNKKRACIRWTQTPFRQK